MLETQKQSQLLYTSKRSTDGLNFHVQCVIYLYQVECVVISDCFNVKSIPRDRFIS